MDKFEEQIHGDLHQYLLSVNEIDERLPECPDVEGKCVSTGIDALGKRATWYEDAANAICLYLFLSADNQRDIIKLAKKW